MELVTVVGSHGVDPEREALDDMVDEVDGARLRVLIADLQSTDARGVVNRSELVALHPSSLWTRELQRLHVNLHVMAGHLLLVALAHDGAPGAVGWQSAHPMALEHAVHPAPRHPESVVALQIPRDPVGTKAVDAPQMQDLLFDLGRRLSRMAVRPWTPVGQTRLTLGFVSVPSSCRSIAA